MDKFYVRLVSIVLNMYIGFQLIYGWFGEYVYNLDLIISCPIWAALLLVILGNTQKSYHCAYVKMLQWNLLLFSVISYIDAQFCIFPTSVIQLTILSFIWLIFVFISLFLAFKHFVKWNTRRKKKGRYAVYRLR